MRINTLLKEPLVHFLMIGLTIFALYSLTRDVTTEKPNRIVISTGKIEQLTANFKRIWMRDPSLEELHALTETYVREEVFYREAIAMGLDQNDAQVRQRMRMKLEYMLEDLSAHSVTDDDLSDFLEKNSDKFRNELKLSFKQVYLNPDKRIDIALDAKALLVKLNTGMEANLIGDTTLLPLKFNLASESNISQNLGKDFLSAVINLSPGNWIGPVYSSYGAHLLKVTERIESSNPTLNEVRAAVTREFLVELQNKQKEVVYKKLRDSYEIIIEPFSTKASSSIVAVPLGQNNRG